MSMQEPEVEDVTWGVDEMFKVYEEELYQIQPFMYHDFGTKSLFEEFERRMKKDHWIRSSQKEMWECLVTTPR